ncbi:hypothetical protein XA68_10521 [Ophiocordyceps unilateralis]|uniref:Uncharacterized protein n=1 Tax=Ophiocordyceps unilateralis TaxID=268505 RepID=A0A2A9P2P4_OPHUN|nr:hypothetical protein XA68_10521 [Ophiocordyceps unilateralis]
MEWYSGDLDDESRRELVSEGGYGQWRLKLTKRFAIRPEIASRALQRERFTAQKLLEGADFRGWISKMKRIAKAALHPEHGILMIVYDRLDVLLKESFRQPTGDDDLDEWALDCEILIPNL